MVNIEIIKQMPINMSTLKEELENIKKRDKELNYRANNTYEYLCQFSKLSARQAEELYADIDQLQIPRLKDVHIHKIIDVLPNSEEELKVLLQGYTLTVNNDNLKKIISSIKKFVKE